MDTLTLVLTFVAAFAASATQSFAGFGFGLTIVPLLALIAGPRNAVIAANVLGTILPACLAWLLRADADWRLSLRLSASAAAGLPFGFLLIWIAPESAIQVLISVVVVLAVIALARGFRIERQSHLLDSAVGFTSGALRSSTSMSGPPVVLYLQGYGTTRASFRATLSAYFAITGAMTVLVFALAGDIDGEILALVLAGGPGMFAGIVAGQLLHGRVNDAWFQRVVLVVLVVSAVLGAGRAVT